MVRGAPRGEHGRKIRPISGNRSAFPHSDACFRDAVSGPA